MNVQLNIWRQAGRQHFSRELPCFFFASSHLTVWGQPSNPTPNSASRLLNLFYFVFWFMHYCAVFVFSAFFPCGNFFFGQPLLFVFFLWRLSAMVPGGRLSIPGPEIGDKLELFNENWCSMARRASHGWCFF